ncbi:ABC transporter permease [Pseudoduganella sp. GCM10020061]|uniref:ABC transporter permease n=1 Tax=Pseudoduganella sp. GCM10020061 TaxID=3317345 RepID=UPI0036365F54
MFRNYLLTAWNVFMRRKLFTAINLLCIVLTLVVLMVSTALLESLLQPSGIEGKSGRFLEVSKLTQSSADGSSRATSRLGYKLIDKYLKPMQSAHLVAAATSASLVSVYQGDRVTELDLRRVDTNYWKIFDFKLLAGRLPTLEDEQQGHMVAVINASVARRLFGAGPAVAQPLDVAGQAFRVIGVVADIPAQLHAYSEIWAPVTTFPTSSYRDAMEGPFSALLLADSTADVSRIKNEVMQIAGRIPPNGDLTVTHLWADSRLDDIARGILVNNNKPDSGAGTLVMIIATAMFLFMLLPALNLINLNTGRILERSSEIGVRRSFGATSAQLAGQFLIENTVLCLIGGVIGLAFTAAILAWLEGSGLIPYLKVNLNLAVVGYCTLITFVFGILSGLIPAWKMSRLDPVLALKGTA